MKLSSAEVIVVVIAVPPSAALCDIVVPHFDSSTKLKALTRSLSLQTTFLERASEDRKRTVNS